MKITDVTMKIEENELVCRVKTDLSSDEFGMAFPWSGPKEVGEVTAMFDLCRTAIRRIQ